MSTCAIFLQVVANQRKRGVYSQIWCASLSKGAQLIVPQIVPQNILGYERAQKGLHKDCARLRAFAKLSVAQGFYLAHANRRPNQPGLKTTTRHNMLGLWPQLKPHSTSSSI